MSQDGTYGPPGCSGQALRCDRCWWGHWWDHYRDGAIGGTTTGTDKRQLTGMLPREGNNRVPWGLSTVSRGGKVLRRFKELLTPLTTLLLCTLSSILRTHVKKGQVWWCLVIPELGR